MITAIKAFEGGSCRHLLAMVDRRSWRMVDFPAVFLALRHAQAGWVLVDTGYGGRFEAATGPFPQRFYRWATPTKSGGTTGAALQQAGIAPAEIRHVVVTHFHADHVGGLAEFPHATIHHHAGALAPLQALPGWRQVRAAFLASLVPAWLPARANAIAADAFGPAADLPFRVHDLFGDGSIRLVDLPGHAPGQVGVAFRSARGAELYAADAYWRGAQLSPGVEPFGVAMSLQWDPAAYRRSVGQLRELQRAGAWRLSACHDEGVAGQLNSLAP